ncbi:MAG TPA: hypothetical protein VFW07_25155 [Parafilimonas sp.]|nr:hypothetical protein [Parafilimonas sp.]
MYNGQAERKRFYKPHHFLSDENGSIMKGLEQVFIDYHPCDFIEDLREWQMLAMINEQSAYDEGSARENVLDFTAALMKLSEALWLVYEKNCRDKATKILKHAADVRLQLLSKKETANPHKVIQYFCYTFSKRYAKIELLDLLEAVITYEGDRQVYKGSLILMYQHLDYLVKAAYNIHKRQFKL